jgi:transaldolase/glucose-6-phosphate isomerase
MSNPLRSLQEYGQSVWLDFLSRDLFRSGELNRLIAEDGLRGMTSNPSIFEKAIGHGDDYDAQIAELEAVGDLDPGTLFERLAVTDIQHAADALRPVYDQTQRRDGYVSIEVSPYLAMQTAATIDEARRLWREVGRDNVMIKIPATRPGLPAVRTMIAEGVNINITLLFSQKVYAEVAEAYISGLETFVGKGGDPHKVASVASFFVSRIDTMVDEALDKKIAAAADPAEKARLKGLQGKIAIANAKLAYQMYQRIFRDERWQRLAQQGAQTQRLLWASTGTKDPKAPDILYVKSLAAPHTVNTMPENTLHALADHGEIGAMLPHDGGDAERKLAEFTRAGVDIDALAEQLQREGAAAFVKSWEDLMQCLVEKSATLKKAS